MLPLPETEFKSKIVNKDYQIAVAPILCEGEYAIDFLNSLSDSNSSNFVKIYIPSISGTLILSEIV